LLEDPGEEGYISVVMVTFVFRLESTSMKKLSVFRISDKRLCTCIIIISRGSSVSIVSGYGLDDRVIEVRSPAEVKGFFL
jgi:hypothetical protein